MSSVLMTAVGIRPQPVFSKYHERRQTWFNERHRQAS